MKRHLQLIFVQSFIELNFAITEIYIFLFLPMTVQIDDRRQPLKSSFGLLVPMVLFSDNEIAYLAL
jgi:hypothetical protein